MNISDKKVMNKSKLVNYDYYSKKSMLCEKKKIDQYFSWRGLRDKETVWLTEAPPLDKTDICTREVMVEDGSKHKANGILYVSTGNQKVISEYTVPIKNNYQKKIDGYGFTYNAKNGFIPDRYVDVNLPDTFETKYKYSYEWYQYYKTIPIPINIPCYCFMCYGYTITEKQNILIKGECINYCLSCGFKCHKYEQKGESYIYPSHFNLSYCGSCDCLNCITKRYDELDYFTNKIKGIGCVNNKKDLIDCHIELIPEIINAQIKNRLYNKYLSCENCREKIIKLGNCFACNQKHHDLSNINNCGEICYKCHCFNCVKLMVERKPIMIGYIWKEEDQVATDIQYLKNIRDKILQVNSTVIFPNYNLNDKCNEVEMIIINPNDFLIKIKENIHVYREIAKIESISSKCDYNTCKGQSDVGKRISLLQNNKRYHMLVCNECLKVSSEQGNYLI